MKERTQIPVTPLSIPSKETNPSAERFVSLTPSGFTQLPETIFDTKTVVHSKIETPLPRSFPEDGLTARVATPPKSNPLLRWETLLIIIILLIAGLAHGINMFHFPYYEDDEGTYLSQAWAVFHTGHLAYYTYWYDHAPMGWIQIAIWAVITGGFHTFGSAIDSGRIFMLLLQLGSTFVLYRIARTISGSMLVAAIVALLFALSPYGLYYHRRILLDNIMTFWLLLSILLLLASHLSLKHIWLSAITLGISSLSKEVAIFAIPALAYLVWVRADKSNRMIAFTGWLSLVLMILSMYFLFATIKGELFPTGTLLGGHNDHVSLLGTLLYQGSRGKDRGIFDFSSSFWHWAMIWVHDDPIVIVGGSLSVILAILLLKKHRLVGIMGLITLSLWAFVARGGVVLDFYLIPILPMSALTLGLMLGLLAKYLNRLLKILFRSNLMSSRIIQPTIILLCLASMIAVIPPPNSGVGYGASNIGSKDDPFIYWNSSQAVAQREAVTWIEGHVPSKSRIIIDMYMWPDLYSKGFKNAHYYWKLETDPAIRMNVFHNSWRNVDYIVTTSQMLQDMQIAHMNIVKSLIENSATVAAFDTGGWRIDIRKVHK